MVNLQMLLAVGAAVLLVGAAQDTAPTTTSTSEPLTVTSLASSLVDTVDAFRGAVADALADRAEEVLEALGVQEAIEAVTQSLDQLNTLKDKAVEAADGLMEFFEDTATVETFLADIPDLANSLKPYIRTFSGQCNSTTTTAAASADRAAMLLEAQQNHQKRRVVKPLEDCCAIGYLCASKANSNFGCPLFTVTIGFSVSYEGLKVGSFQFTPSVGLGWSIGLEAVPGGKANLFSGLGLGWGAGINYERQNKNTSATTPAPSTPAPRTPAPRTPAPRTPAPRTPAPRTPAPRTPAPATPAPPTPAPDRELSVLTPRAVESDGCTSDNDCGLNEECENGVCVKETSFGHGGKVLSAEQEKEKKKEREGEVLFRGRTKKKARSGEKTGEKGFFANTLFEVSLSVEWFASAGAFSGFAFEVGIDMPAIISSTVGIDGITIVFTHPHWRCVEVISASTWWENVLFGGFGVSLKSWGKHIFKKKNREAIRDMDFALDGLAGKIKEAVKELPRSWLSQKRSSITDAKGNKWSGIGFSLGMAVTLEDSNKGASVAYDPSACPMDSASASTATGARMYTSIVKGDDNKNDGVNTTTTTTTTKHSTRELLDASSDLGDFLELMKPILQKGEVTMPFCLGNCAAPTPTTTVSGVGRIGQTPACDGVEASVWVEELTMANVAYLVTSNFDEGVAQALDTALSPVLSFGIQDTKLALAATTSGVKLYAIGSPKLPDILEGDFLEVVGDVTENFRVSASAELQFSGSALLELRIGTDPDTSESNFAIVNVEGTLGMSIYAQYEHNFGGLPLSKLGVNIPLKICVERCKEDYEERRFLFLIGDLSLVVSPSAQLVRGSLKLDGWWYRALGLPFLHIGDVILGVEWDLKSPVPTGFTLGGAVCFGKEGSCTTKTGAYIEGRTYVGVSGTVPEDNFFIAMVSELTIGGIIDVLSDYVPALDKVVIPGKLAESGIYPFDKDYKTRCAGKLDGYANETTLDLECFAFFSFSPIKEQRLSFRSGDVVIPAGVALQGRLNFLGWEIAIDLAVSKTRFYIDAWMDHVDLKIGAFQLRIGNRLENKVAVGGAKFLVDLQVKPQPRALIDIGGAFDIPMLRSYGYLNVTLNADIFSFRAGIDLFDGALSSHVHVTWNWDLTFFKMELRDMNFLEIVKIRQVLFMYDLNRPIPYAIFSCDIQVLFINLRARVEVNGNVIDFAVTLDLALVETTVSGHAVVAKRFEDSEFDISVSVSLGDLGQKIVDGINVAVKAIAKAATEAWNYISEKVTVLWNKVKRIFETTLRYIKDKVEEFLNNVAAAFRDAVTWLKGIPVLGDIVRAGERLLRGDFEGAAQSIGSISGLFHTAGHRIVGAGGRNEYGCRYLRAQWKECWCHLFCFFGKTCKTKHGPRYADPGCMEEVALAAADVKTKTDEMAQKNAIIEGSKEENPGLQNIASGMEVPMPSLPKSTVMVPFGSNAATASGGFSGGVRTYGGKGSGGGLSASEAEVTLSNMPYDLSSQASYEASVRNTQNRMVSAMADKALEKQALLNGEVSSEAGMVLRKRPVLGGATSYTFRCDQPVNLESLKPLPWFVDPACTSGARVNLLRQRVLPESQFPNRVCGSSFLEVTWQLRDSPVCGGVSEEVTQIITVEPISPVFASFPADTRVNTEQSTDPTVLGLAEGASACSQEFDVFYMDSDPVPVEGSNGNGQWTVNRVWTILPFFPKSECTGATAEGSSRTQTITVVDETTSAPSTPQPAPVSVPATPPSSSSSSSSSSGDSRLVASIGNWQECPTDAQMEAYTHILVSFAVTYTWGPMKNQCNQQCDLTPVSVCGNAPHPELVAKWKAAGKKVMLSFGGAGMGGSWDGLNDCWEHCYGKEEHLVRQLVAVASSLGFDGINLDYGYYYEDGQRGSSFAKGAQAQAFLKEVTVGLKQNLPTGSLVTHSPVDIDLAKGTRYFDIMKEVAGSVDFVMPQYYNGITRPNTDGINGGVFSSALAHFKTLVEDCFGNDPTKVVFGFCIGDCGDTNSNSNAQQAVSVMNDLKQEYACNGGAFFWNSLRDTNGAWSKAVGGAVSPARGCGGNSGGGVPTNPSPATVTAPTPALSTASVDSRLIAYIGNWQACPTDAQMEAYTHILVSFAVTYTWTPRGNQCNQQCKITGSVPVCGNSPQPELVAKWKAAGKKVMLSFGGAGMGGSWDGLNDCWEHCYGKEASVVRQLVAVASSQGFDGINLDYEYYYEDGQRGSSFAKGAQAQAFLKEVTVGLKQNLPTGSLVTHSPVDIDLAKGTRYFDIIREVAGSVDFVMPQYYNGITRPNTDGINGGVFSSALAHFKTLVEDCFGSDPTKVVFGFCISDCGGTNSNSNAQQAVSVMNDLKQEYACNGGAFFWNAAHDLMGAWSKAVGGTVSPARGCGGSVK